MPKPNMPKEEMDYIMHKLYHKRNTLFRAFLINYVLVFLVWILSMTGIYDSLVGFFMPNMPVDFDAYMLWLLGAWKIAGIVLFLVPAFATWWEIAAYRKAK